MPGSAYRSVINVRGVPCASGRDPPPGRTGALAACSAALMVELDTPSRAPTSRMVIPVAYSCTALACNTFGDQADRGAILRDAGIPRRTSRKDCPVDADTLRAMVETGGTVALGRRRCRA